MIPALSLQLFAKERLFFFFFFSGDPHLFVCRLHSLVVQRAEQSELAAKR